VSEALLQCTLTHTNMLGRLFSFYSFVECDYGCYYYLIGGFDGKALIGTRSFFTLPGLKFEPWLFSSLVGDVDEEECVWGGGVCSKILV
jgi:hypothetical protein